MRLTPRPSSTERVGCAAINATYDDRPAALLQLVSGQYLATGAAELDRSKLRCCLKRNSGNGAGGAGNLDDYDLVAGAVLEFQKQLYSKAAPFGQSPALTPFSRADQAAHPFCCGPCGGQAQWQ